MLESKTYLAVPPGETLKEQLEDRGMSQKELAERMGVSSKHVSELINGQVGLSERIAMKLEVVLGIPAEFWLNLEHIYREDLILAQEENDLEAEKELLKKLPYAILSKFGWVKETRKPADKIRNLRKYFHVSKLTDAFEKQLLPSIAYRKLLKTKKSDLVTICWLQKAKNIAEDARINKEIKPVDLDGLKRILPMIKSMSLKEEEKIKEELPSLLASYGIILVLLPSLSGSGLQGASFYLGDRIILAISDRSKDSDKFWFTLFHEFGHIFNGDLNRHLENDSDENEIRMENDIEKKADQFSRDTLINPDDFERFSLGKNTFTLEEINLFAKQQGIHPSIVVGRLQKDEFIPYSAFNDVKTKYIFS